MRADAASSAPVSSALTTSSSALVRSKCWRFSDLTTSTQEYARAVDRLDRERGEQRAGVEVVGVVAGVRRVGEHDHRRHPLEPGAHEVVAVARVAADERRRRPRRPASVSRSARITISRWSSTSRARSSRMISGPLGLHPQIRMWSRPLNVAHPCSLSDDGGHEPRGDRGGGERDEAHARDPDDPVRHEAELGLQLVGRRVLEQRAGEPAVRVADGVDVVAAAVLDRPEEDRREEQHQEAERRGDEEPTAHAIEHRLPQPSMRTAVRRGGSVDARGREGLRDRRSGTRRLRPTSDPRARGSRPR